jgi:hypothetical protein
VRRILMMLAVAASVACNDSSTGLSSVEGTYTLRSINGTNLPYTVLQSGTTKIEVTDDVITLNSNGTFTETGHTRTTTNGVATSNLGTDTGTYTTSGTAITLRYNSDASTSSGSVNGDQLIIVDQGLSAVYTR